MNIAILLNRAFYEREMSYTSSEEYSYVLMRSYKEQFHEIV
ncbi:MAG: hypothetical protein ACRC3H_12170 [Lachnospiraceae bacterium]